MHARRKGKRKQQDDIGLKIPELTPGLLAMTARVEGEEASSAVAQEYAEALLLQALYRGDYDVEEANRFLATRVRLEDRVCAEPSNTESQVIATVLRKIPEDEILPEWAIAELAQHGIDARG